MPSRVPRRLRHQSLLRLVASPAVAVPCMALLLTGAALLGLSAYWRTRIMPGTSVAGVSVSGLTAAEAYTRLAQRVEALSLGTELLLEDGTRVRMPLASLGVGVRLDEALEQARSRGRSDEGGIFTGIRVVLDASRAPRNIPLRSVIDEAALAAALSHEPVAARVRPAANATVTVRSGTAIVQASRVGTRVDSAALAAHLAENISALQSKPIPVRIVPDEPKRTTEAAEHIKTAYTRALATAPYALYIGGARFTVTRAQVRDWLTVSPSDTTFQLVVDPEGAKAALLALAPAVSRPAQDVVLGADGPGRPLTIAKPSIPEVRLNVEETYARLSRAIARGERTVDGALTETPARVTEADVRARGITHLLGTGNSDFAGSPKSRVKNIRVATEKYRGLLLGPGDTFSFNAYLGPVDESGGYVPELVIKDKKLIPEYGGGVCQVSTTFFRAALAAGLMVVERTNHSIPVSYYGAPGFDATVYPPSPDLKFTNTTTGTLFVQPRIEGTVLAVDLFGSWDGRTTDISVPRVVERRDDGSIKTVVTQKVTKRGAVVQQKSFWSVYKNPKLYQKIERNPLE